VIDTQTPNSPGWWLNRLILALGARQSRYDLLDSYYTGEVGPPVTATKAVRQAYQRLMAMAGTNFAELVVEAVRERMVPSGFRTGADSDELGDAEAWRIWQANSLDADAPLVHRASLTMGDAYVIVGGVDDTIGAPLITPEDPREVIAERDPVRRRKVVAALKVFADDVQQVQWAYLYLTGQVWRAVRENPPSGTGLEPSPGTVSLDASGWEWAGKPDDLPAPVVPVVPFPNRDTLAGRRDGMGRSWGEFEPHRAILDRINYTILNRLEIATLQAFRQRGLKGNFPDNDPQGNPINYDDVFAADPGALWLLPETTDVWESGQVDLGPIRQAIRDDVQDLAAVTRTPLFYLTPDAANGSAEGASLAREGLVFKTADRIVQASESWEQVMSLAFLFAGDTERASRADMETLWASPERFSLAERYDAASKAQAAGVPWRAVMTDVLQFSPQQVDRMEAQRATDTFLAAPAAAPTVRRLERDAEGRVAQIVEEAQL
jgi:SPP1 Gp6-like portal protein